MFSPARIPKSGVKIKAKSSSIVDCKINNIVLETMTPAVFELSFDIPEELEILSFYKHPYLAPVVEFSCGTLKL